MRKIQRRRKKKCEREEYIIEIRKEDRQPEIHILSYTEDICKPTYVLLRAN